MGYPQTLGDQERRVIVLLALELHKHKYSNICDVTFNR